MSVHPTRPLAISTSRTEGILWDTELWERKRLLVGAQSGVRQAVFSADGSTIISAFADGSILLWNVDTFNLNWKISLERFSGDPLIPCGEHDTGFGRSSMAASRNGEVLVEAGGSSTVFVWNLAEKRLMHEILVPTFESKRIVQVDFLGDSNIVALLSDAGDLLFIDAAEARFVGKLEGKRKFMSFAASPNGRLLSTVFLDSTSTIGLVRVEKLLEPQKCEVVGDIAEQEEASFEMLNESKQSGADEGLRTTVAVSPDQAKTLYELVDLGPETKTLSRSKLKTFLYYYGSYPETYRSVVFHAYARAPILKEAGSRTLIWRFLLHLPENRDSYESLLEQGVHPSVKDFRKRFPLKSGRSLKSMERVLSALAYWSPIFENLDYLPSLVFPFVKIFLRDMFVGFEVVMTVLVNWCQKWWEYYPNPPIECLNVIEDLLAFHDGALLEHFVQCGIYAWTLMQSFFAQILSGSEWSMLWDHFLTNGPDFLYYFVVAFLKSHRTALMGVKNAKDFDFFFTRPNPTISALHIIRSAYALQRRTPRTVSPSSFLEPFLPIPQGEYPFFNAYPEFIIDYQCRMKEKIREEEAELGRRRKMADEITQLTEELRRDKRAWESADWKMNEMVERWWDQMMGDEASHRERQARLDAMDKEQRAKAMHNIAEARRSFITHHLDTTQRHLANLAKAMGNNRGALDSAVENGINSARFTDVEDEWVKRGQEMMRVREVVKDVDRMRLERLVRNAREVGIRETDVDDILLRRKRLNEFHSVSDGGSGLAKGKSRAWTPVSPLSSPVKEPEREASSRISREGSPVKSVTFEGV
ncbi:hypothetical protein SpCBS45565_g06095 [Spizellomyces sp. 'palustris']|nr:hypothetical protein SpCBS45565_g06095 [Spizellomyces sp. 'palustris']